MADISKIKLPGDNTEYTIKDSGAARNSHSHIKSEITDFPTLATVATSGSYNDLTNKPTIPSVGNGSLTVKAGTTAGGTFTANQSGASTIVIDATTHKELQDAIDALPEPMVFKGTLGTNGTITSLPTAAAANEGWTYKVITAGTYASQAAKIGDLFISTGSEWTWVPSGDEPSGTVTNVAISNGGGIGISGSPITSSGTITLTNTGVRSITQDSSDGHKLIVNTNGSNTTITIPDNNTTYSNATTSTAGLMSSSDKTKLDGIATGATKVTVDSALSSTSTNPVQNKAVNTAITNLKTLVGDTAVATQISNAVASKADTNHTHDNRYYTETEVDNYQLITTSEVDAICVIPEAIITISYTADGEDYSCTADMSFEQAKSYIINLGRLYVTVEDNTGWYEYFETGCDIVYALEDNNTCIKTYSMYRPSDYITWNASEIQIHTVPM